MVCVKISSPLLLPNVLEGTMVEYLDKLHALHDFNELLPPASTTPSQELEQRSKFFMLFGLHDLHDDYSYVRD